MPIIRTRNGCQQCRKRKKKCDEVKPKCGACLRLRLACEASSSSFRFVSGTELSNKKGREDSITRQPQPSQYINGSEGSVLNEVPHDGGEYSRSTSFENLLPTKENHSALLRNHELSAVELWFSSFVDFDQPTTSARNANPLERIDVQQGCDDDLYVQLYEKLYLHHWRQAFVEKLPAAYRYFDNIIGGCLALRSAMIAFSACDLARTNTEVRCYSAGLSVRFDYGRNKRHETNAYKWYNKAVCELARMDYEKQDKISVLATLLIFTQIEMQIGSYRGAAFHHHGIEHLLSSDDKICERPPGKKLVAAWVTSRSLNWSRRIPFTLLSFERTLGKLGVDSNSVLDPSYAPDEAIIVIMLQSWYLSLMLLFEQYAGRGDMESISSRCVRDIFRRMKHIPSGESWQPKLPITDEDYGNLLQRQRIKLEQWYATLQLQQLPIGQADIDTEPAQLNMPHIAPSYLSFHCPRAAINYAYYIVARIVQSGSILDGYLSGDDFDDKTKEVDSEADNLLRILSQVLVNLDITTCVRYSTYTVGLCQLLGMCQLRLPRHNATICNLSDYLVRKLEDNCISTDGHVLLSDFKQELDQIEEQRVQGKDLFYVVPRISPDDMYQAGSDFSSRPAVVYGRERATGRLFCNVLPPIM